MKSYEITCVFDKGSNIVGPMEKVVNVGPVDLTDLFSCTTWISALDSESILCVYMCVCQWNNALASKTEGQLVKSKISIVQYPYIPISIPSTT